jgi:restriction system protein
MLKMHDNSLFAILLRSPWWVSLLVSGAAGALSSWALQKFGMHPGYAVFVASPFFVIACVAGWRQLRAPSAAKVAASVDALCALGWDEFAARLEGAYRRQGYEVRRLSGAADLELEKGGRVTLVAGKRWKATRTGAEPLRELDALRRRREANDAVYIAARQVTDTAREFAATSDVQLLEGPALAALLAA